MYYKFIFSGSPAILLVHQVDSILLKNDRSSAMSQNSTRTKLPDSRLRFLFLFILVLFLCIGFVFFVASAKRKVSEPGPNMTQEPSESVFREDFVYAQVLQYPDQYAVENGDVGMFYAIKTADDKVIIIDGGNSGNESYVRDVIEELGNHVDAWIITHQHCDHVGAFNEIYADPQDITIRRVYSNYVPDEIWNASPGNQTDPRDIPAHTRFNQLMSSADNITWLHEGDEFQVSELHIKVYAAYDEALTAYYGNDLGNISSLVFKISSGDSSMLFCGDLRTPEMCSYLIDRYGEDLRADYYQIGHHGNSSVSKEFINTVSPSIVFFDCPEWLYDSAQHDASENWDYCQSLGAICYRWSSGEPNTASLA